MPTIFVNFSDALQLALSFDPQLVSIIVLTLKVSLASTVCAALAGGALGAAVAGGHFADAAR